jgi:myo-inositol catabolism protein IolS
METATVGPTDLRTSRIGFGCWAMGGHGYGHVDDRESIQAVRKALDVGINLFDTADVYGFGHSEEVLAEGLGDQRKNVIIATKFGVCWDEQGETFKDCSPRRVFEAVEGSLRRLQIDCIPLYQIHWHDGKTPLEEVMDALERCREAGKILHVGCCNLSQDLLLTACRNHKLVSYQCLYSLARRENEETIRNAAIEQGIGTLPFGVIGRGVFSGKFAETSRFGEKDTRKEDKDFQGNQLKKNLSIADALEKIGKKYEKTSSQVAIRWVLDNPDVTCALVGMKNEKQVSENFGALGWSLEQSDFEQIGSLA